MKEFKIGRKRIGILDGGVFFKEVYKSKHLFMVLDAWGIDSKTLHEIPKGTRIVIHEQESNILYKTTREEYLENGEYYHFKNQSEDHRTQLFLRRKFFTMEYPKELTPEEKEKKSYMMAMGF